ncbi:type 2 isopentenyl-diphosphate Delta-isomerase [Gorillibacterium massiliense]|uniref:type 2 isopentenyl-diphosphate Delta-isomerase n=1 Tax=Gorillibacterium massiliense TaxID=1280390 RepID=UPI0004B6D2F1|nr:type 2 isopentenyl-diphosphate Delta-isomerase [Gorillibacterium massiliense]
MRESRKMDHIHHALRLGPSGGNGLSDIQLVPDSLPETNAYAISLETQIGELILSSPIVINAMTGGALAVSPINQSLAEAAAECGVAMAVGSQMAALKDPILTESYSIVRRINPHGIVIANLGAEATVEQARAAVDMLEANALQIHLNVMQELVMPEGDRDFRGAGERIERIIQSVGVPVIIKEVGFGLSAATALKLKKRGAAILDVGGRGGTNFAAIENERRDQSLAWTNGWGLSTTQSLLEVLPHFSAASVIASGGITDSLDAVKALALGAGAVGIAGAVLRACNSGGAAGAAAFIGEMEEGIRIAMAALGARSLAELREKPLVVSGTTLEWCRERGIETKGYARRGGQD